MKIKSLAPIALAIVLLWSCVKEDAPQKNTNGPKCIQKNEMVIPSYKSYDELLTIMTVAEETGDLSNYPEIEKISAGLIADNFFRGINPNDFTNESELEEFFAKNKTYLDTIVDENNEVAIYPKWHDNSFRYVANIEGLFIVDGYVSRIFKHGIITKKQDSLDYLINLTEQEAYNEMRPSSKGVPVPALNHWTCRTPLEWTTSTLMNRTTNGDNRLTIKLVSVFNRPGGMPHVHTSVKVTTEHYALWWWPENHTMSCTGQVITDRKTYATPAWDTSVSYVSEQKGGYIMDCFVNDTYTLDYEQEDVYHYWSYNLTATSPAVGSVSLIHIHQYINNK